MFRFLLPALLLAGGCMSTVEAHRDKLVSRAAFDLRCDGEDIAIKQFDDITARAEGCKKEQTYTWDAKKGTWIKD